MQGKKFWRCSVCGDLHHGKNAPETCPTCSSPRSKAHEISEEEFLSALNAVKK